MGFCGGDSDENDYEIGYREGAAVMGGLLGMAEAIRETERRRPWPHHPARWCCFCGERCTEAYKDQLMARCPDCGVVEWVDTQPTDPNETTQRRGEDPR